MPNTVNGCREHYVEQLVGQLRQIPGYLTESDAGPLVNINALDPLIDCISKCSHQTRADSLREFSASFIEYLSYIKTVDTLQDKKLLLQLNTNGDALACCTIKPRRAPLSLAHKPDRVYLQDVDGKKYIDDKKTISLDDFCCLKKQAKLSIAREGSLASNAAFAKKQRATGQAIAGHGALDKDYVSFTLPDNITLRTYCVQGQVMPDRLGIHIEAGKYAAVSDQTFTRVYHPGNFVPDYRIYPPDARINTLPGSITVPHATDLSKIIDVLSGIAKKEGKPMTIDLATCQSYLLPDPIRQPKDNLNARIDPNVAKTKLPTPP